MGEQRNGQSIRCPNAVVGLIAPSADQLDTSTHFTYNETQVRYEFIDPMFIALGWDVRNRAGHGEAHQDFIHLVEMAVTLASLGLGLQELNTNTRILRRYPIGHNLGCSSAAPARIEPHAGRRCAATRPRTMTSQSIQGSTNRLAILQGSRA